MNLSDLNTHDWFDIALGVISLFGSAVAIMATVFAIRLAADANVLAQRAVEIDLFKHKQEVAPSLELRWSVQDTDVELFLKNENSGRASIKAIASSLDDELQPYGGFAGK